MFYTHSFRPYTANGMLQYATHDQLTHGVRKPVTNQPSHLWQHLTAMVVGARVLQMGWQPETMGCHEPGWSWGAWLVHGNHRLHRVGMNVSSLYRLSLGGLLQNLRTLALFLSSKNHSDANRKGQIMLFKV